jgi:hypothetical protein
MQRYRPCDTYFFKGKNWSMHFYRCTDPGIPSFPEAIRA